MHTNPNDPPKKVNPKANRIQNKKKKKSPKRKQKKETKNLPKPPFKPPRQLNRHQNSRPIHPHLDLVSPHVVTRAQQTAYLGLPVGHVPLEAMGCDSCGAGKGDDADVFFEEVGFLCFFFFLFFWSGKTWSISPRGGDFVVPRLEDEGYAFFGDEVEVGSFCFCCCFCFSFC